MRSFILVFFFFFVLLAEYSFANGVDERISDIYYGNGILTTERDADRSRFLLQKKLLDEIYGGNVEALQAKHGDEVKLAYNYTAKNAGYSDGVATVLDLLESYEQLTNTSFGWSTFNAIKDVATGFFAKKIVAALIPDVFKKKLMDAGVPEYVADLIISTTGEEALRQTIEQIGDAILRYSPEDVHDTDLKTHVAAYTESIKNSHGVIAITHSQGNLFAVEAYERLVDSNATPINKWLMQKYFHHVSIASPATKFAGDKHWLISLDNDPVASIPLSVGTNVTNPIRHIYYSANISPTTMTAKEMQAWQYNPPVGNDACQNGYWKSWVPLPTECIRTQTITSQLTGISQEYTFTLVPNDSARLFQNGSAHYSGNAFDFHAFGFYMANIDLLPYNSSLLTVEPYRSDITKNDIMSAIRSAINTYNDTDSQWKKSKDISCLGKCDHRITVRHVSGGEELNKKMENMSVYPFTNNGGDETPESWKLYTLENKYIKAPVNGKVITEVFENGKCYDLNGTDAVILGTNTGQGKETKYGAVEITLSWDSCYPLAKIDLDLETNWDVGELDVHDDENSSYEHFVIENDSFIYPGSYWFNANDKTDLSTLDEDKMRLDPVDIYVHAKVPGMQKLYKVAAFVPEQLDLGRILEIDIANKFIFLQGSNSIPPMVSALDKPVARSFSNCSGNRSCGCIPCEYKIRGPLQEVTLGPISGAAVTVYKASDMATPLFVGKTTEGNDIYSTGIIEIPPEEAEIFDDEEIYIIKAQGGVDIDSNDDFVVDEFPVTNNGTLHAIVTGKQLKELSLKVNILAEIAYQVSKDKLSDLSNKAELFAHLDDVAKRILSNKVFPINGDYSIYYSDILLWLPTVDKKLLFKDYDTHVHPIVEKVYADSDYVQDAYKFVYESVTPGAPEIFGFAGEVDVNAPANSIVGALEIASEGTSAITTIILSGAGHENFTVDTKGIFRVAQGASFDMGTTPLYRLEAIAINENGLSSLGAEVIIEVADLPNAPYATALEIIPLVENTPSGTLAAKITFEDAESTVESIF